MEDWEDWKDGRLDLLDLAIQQARAGPCLDTTFKM